MTKHSPSCPAVEAASAGCTINAKRNTRHVLLINLFVALGSIIIYQSICSFLWSPDPRLSNRPTTSTSSSSSFERRNNVEKRAPGDEIWNDIEPSNQIEWHQCYDKFECTRFEVPLDYWNGTEGTTTLGIVKLSAQVPVTNPRYGGPLLYNPGGPGVSATSLVLQMGPGFQSTFDTPEEPSSTEGNDDARYYDIVGIDPRGVGQSIPSASCFETDLQLAEWTLREAAAGIPGSSDVSVAESWGRTRAYTLACYNLSQNRSRADNIMPYITTASIARDMITFVDRYAEWREAEARRTLEGQIPERLLCKAGKEKVQFYGYSWGSFLGETFASMFPERTGRFILDAIVDTDDYIHGLWTFNVLDSEKTLGIFYSDCAAAGPTNCALAKNGSNADDIRKRVDDILNFLYRNPIAGTDKIPNMLTWSDVRQTFMTDLYQPLLWSELATALAALEGVLSSPLVAASTSTYYPVPGSITEPYQNFAAEAGIACGDAFDEGGNFTLQDAEAHWNHLQELSPTMAPIYAPLRYLCAAWRHQEKYSYRGPFGASADTGIPPILFVGNTADPVTPIRGARKMAERFSGARLLTLDIPGHSSLALPSTCLMHHLRAYMQKGELPEEGFVCEPSERPFNGSSPAL